MMTQADYNLRVSYAPIQRAPRRRVRSSLPRSMALPEHVAARKRESNSSVIRGLLMAAPLSALLWVPMIWEASKLL